VENGVEIAHIAIVLNRPKYAGNVGSAARCAKNMGIDRLIVVGNGDLDEEEMRMRATHEAADLIERLERPTDLGEALADFQYVVGASARTGGARGPVCSPREMAEKVVAIARHNTIALLFGPEDAGLSNDDLKYCHLLVNIPTADFKSLNLSHAVMVLAYEIFVARGIRIKTFKSRLATVAELEGMYGQVQDLLMRMGFLNPQNPDYWMLHLRRMFSRTDLTAKEVKIIRGICRQFDWWAENKNT
jgi:tRNA/rRNA methyltransferase